MSNHRGKAFTTKDSDNDDWAGNNCTTHFKGAWWNANCYNSNLNGQYYVGGRLGKDGGVDWSRQVRGHENSSSTLLKAKGLAARIVHLDNEAGGRLGVQVHF